MAHIAAPTTGTHATANDDPHTDISINLPDHLADNLVIHVDSEIFKLDRSLFSISPGTEDDSNRLLELAS